MNELEFKRPGKVEIKVSKCASGRVYATVWQDTKKGWQHRATVHSVHPDQCQLLAYNDGWVLCAGDHARFHLTPEEGQKVHERLDIRVEVQP